MSKNEIRKSFRYNLNKHCYVFMGYWLNKRDFDEKIIHIVWFEFRTMRFALDIEFNTKRKYYFHIYPIIKRSK